MNIEKLIKEAEAVQKLAWRGYCNIDTSLLTVEQAQSLNSTEFARTMHAIKVMGMLIDKLENKGE